MKRRLPQRTRRVRPTGSRPGIAQSQSKTGRTRRIPKISLACTNGERSRHHRILFGNDGGIAVNIRILLLPVVCGVLAACQSVQGERATYVGDGITVDPQIEWTHAIGPRESSIPGLGLDRLLFLTA